ncbi:MAG: DUF433 domain-containing protein [Thermomicrobiales bacterium]
MATTVERRPAPIERTEHPHIVKSMDTLGGEPRIEDTRMPVRQIYELSEAGTSPDEIIESFPWLTHAQIFDALSYAYDHPEEIAHHQERHKLRNVMRKHNLVYMNGTLLLPRQYAALTEIPANARIYTWETLPEEMAE